jgi:flagella basal body P-ring formation protein FlgA
MNRTARTLVLLAGAVVLGFCATATFVVPVRAQAAAQPGATPAAALPARPVMKRDIVVSREIITLGDVVEHAGGAADAGAFRAPALGRTGTIQASRVAEAVRQAGLPALDTGLVSQVVVTRAARKIAKAEIEEAVRKALAGRYGLEQVDVTLTLEGNETIVYVEPEAAGDIKVQDLLLDPKAQRLEAVIAIQGSRSLTLKPLRVVGQVVDTVEVPILARSIARGEPVRTSDVRLERRPRAEVAQAGWIDVAALAGRIAKAQLQAGAVLREQDLAKQDIVDKNSVVSVTYETPGLQLTNRAKALESGGIGDAVLIQNPQSKRTLQGTIVGPGHVVVSGPLPGPMASAAPPAEAASAGSVR